MTITARELAERLATYGDMPVQVTVYGLLPDETVHGHHRVSLEFGKTPEGAVAVVVVAQETEEA